MLVGVLIIVPLINHDFYGSAVMIGNTANNNEAPKKLIAPENKLPQYFIFWAVELPSLSLNLNNKLITKHINPP